MLSTSCTVNHCIGGGRFGCSLLMVDTKKTLSTLYIEKQTKFIAINILLGQKDKIINAKMYSCQDALDIFLPLFKKLYYFHIVI